MDLATKTILVTGASRGIGLATAQAFLSCGCRVIINGRSQARLKQAKAELDPSVQDRVLPLAMDVSDVKSMSSVLRDNQELLAEVDVLVNNAGVFATRGLFHENQAEEIAQTLNTNLHGLILLTRTLLPNMIKRKAGHIINIGSVSGRWIHKGAAVYCATKFAVRAFTEGLRIDLIGTPIRITNIEPGLTETGMVQKSRYGDANILEAKDVAEAVVWSSLRPPHVNIQELVIFPTVQPAVGYLHTPQL